MLRRPISRPWQVALGVASFATIVGVYALWYSARQRQDPEDRVLPGWDRLYKEGIVEGLTHRRDGDLQLWVDMKATFGRLFIGLALSVAVALPLGLLMGCYTPMEAYWLPPLAFLAKIPGTAMLQVFFVLPFIGISERFYTAMIVFGIVPTLTQSICFAAKEDVPEELLFKARTLGAGQFSCIVDVILRQILPKILESIRLAIGPSLIFLFAAEYLVAEEGLGYSIRFYANKGVERSPIVFFYLVCVGLFGFLIDKFLIWTRRLICPWYVL